MIVDPSIVPGRHSIIINKENSPIYNNHAKDMKVLFAGIVCTTLISLPLCIYGSSQKNYQCLTAGFAIGVGGCLISLISSCALSCFNQTYHKNENF